MTVCVSDLQQSKRFYYEVLGFKEGKTHKTELAPVSSLTEAFDIKGGASAIGTFVSHRDIASCLVEFTELRLWR